MEEFTYIAETDENGAILSVWVAGPGVRAPRVFDLKKDKLHEEGSTFSGATRQQISAWIAAQTGKAGASPKDS